MHFAKDKNPTSLLVNALMPNQKEIKELSDT
jgi:hypothetical protein